MIELARFSVKLRIQDGASVAKMKKSDWLKRVDLTGHRIHPRDMISGFPPPSYISHKIGLRGVSFP